MQLAFALAHEAADARRTICFKQAFTQRKRNAEVMNSLTCARTRQDCRGILRVTGCSADLSRRLWVMGQILKLFVVLLLVGNHYYNISQPTIILLLSDYRMIYTIVDIPIETILRCQVGRWASILYSVTFCRICLRIIYFLFLSELFWSNLPLSLN